MSWQPPPPPKPGGPGGFGSGYGGQGGSGGAGQGGSGQGGPGGGQQGGGGGQQPGPRPQSGGENYYELLQVDTTAHVTIIRYAYRFLAGIYHPDNSETGNAEMFRQITEAFKTLSDSGRRLAYDAKMGPMLAQKAAATAAGGGDQGLPKPKSNPLPTLDRTSVSYNEVELRLAILQLLLQARKKRVQTGGCSAKVLMDVLGTEMSEMEFALWYLREKEYVERLEAAFMITVKGVDYLVDSLTKTQIIEQGPKNIPSPGSGSNLPAALR